MIKLLCDLNALLAMRYAFAEGTDCCEALHQVATANHRKDHSCAVSLMPSGAFNRLHASLENVYCLAVMAHLVVSCTQIIMCYRAQGWLIVRPYESQCSLAILNGTLGVSR